MPWLALPLLLVVVLVDFVLVVVAALVVDVGADVGADVLADAVVSCSFSFSFCRSWRVSTPIRYADCIFLSPSAVVDGDTHGAQERTHMAAKAIRRYLDRTPTDDVSESAPRP